MSHLTDWFCRLFETRDRVDPMSSDVVVRKFDTGLILSPKMRELLKDTAERLKRD